MWFVSKNYRKELNLCLKKQLKSSNYLKKKLFEWNKKGKICFFLQILDKPKDMPLDVYLQDVFTKQSDSSAKYAFSLWLHIAEMFNFT